MTNSEQSLIGQLKELCDAIFHWMTRNIHTPEGAVKVLSQIKESLIEIIAEQETAQEQRRDISDLSDEDFMDIDQDWENATPEDKLSWYNTINKRPSAKGQYWKELLELTNHFATRKPVLSKQVMDGMRSWYP